MGAESEVHVSGYRHRRGLDPDSVNGQVGQVLAAVTVNSTNDGEADEQPRHLRVRLTVMKVGASEGVGRGVRAVISDGEDRESDDVEAGREADRTPAPRSPAPK